MAGKKFDTQNIADKFFTQGNQENQQNQQIQQKPDINPTAGIGTSQRKPGRPKKEKKLRAYRFSILLDEDLDAFLHEIVWVKRTSMTQYINDLIRQEKEDYVKDCLERGVNPYDGWEKENERHI